MSKAAPSSPTKAAPAAAAAPVASAAAGFAPVPVESRKNVELAISSITKQFGEGSIMRLGENTKMKVETLSTGSLAIDLALGVGGLPRGRIIEIYGPESSGKTTFCLSVIAEAQKRGGLAAFIDVEHALDPKYARVVGVNLDDLLVAQPDSGEDALNITETLIRSNAIDVIVIDSVAALISKQELDGQMGDATVGSQARLMSQAMRRLTAVVSKTKCICIFTNQIREKIGVMFGSPETTPGGRALKFFSSIRIDIRRKDQIKTPDGKVIGNRTKIKVVKNKVAPPFTECEFDIMYDEGISKSGSILDLGLEHKILEKKGAWIAYQGELVGQGRDAAKQTFRERPELAEKVVKAILEKVTVTGGTAVTGDAGEEGVSIIGPSDGVTPWHRLGRVRSR
jgi:recombination protein RecA